MKEHVFLGALALLSACDSVRSSPPSAQPSSPEAASALVRVESGEPFGPACLIVDVGTTVEWRNLSPRASVVVLSVRPPYELSSPSLHAPYNFVPPEQSDECAQKIGSVCAERAPFSFWRHTFGSPGVFDYKDPSGSAAAGQTSVGDGDEYGLPPGPVAAGGGTGTVCVRNESGGCERVCCTGSQPEECGPGVQCIAGRCGGVQP